MPPDSDEEEQTNSKRGEEALPTEGHPGERVLAPEDLDFTKNEKVEQLDEGKFVIGTDSRPEVPPDEQEGRSADQGGSDQSSEDSERGPNQNYEKQSHSEKSEETVGSSSSVGAHPDITGRDVKNFIATELRRTDSQYAYRIAAKTDNRISHQQLASDDVGMAFDGLLMWYAQQVGADTSVEEALGILLAKSNIRIRYPPKLLTGYLRQNDLSPDDEIADLLAIMREEEGLVLPPDVK